MIMTDIVKMLGGVLCFKAILLFQVLYLLRHFLCVCVRVNILIKFKLLLFLYFLYTLPF